MSLSSFIFFAIFFLLALTLFKKGTDVFSPARLFAMVWSFSLGLVELKFSGLQQDWSTYSWLVLAVSLFSVLLGMFIIYVHNFEGANAPITEMRKTIINFRVNSNVLFKIILFLFFAYSLSYLIVYLVAGFIPFFTKRPDLMRARWNVFGAGLIIHSVPTIIYLIVLYYIKVAHQLRNKIVLTMILIISLTSYILLLQRFDLVIFMVLAVMFLYYGTFKLKARLVLILFVVLILLIYGISSIRASNLFLEYLYYGGKMKFDKTYAIFTEPYMYISMNIENFAHAVEKLTNFTYGFFTFDFVLALTGLKHWLFEYHFIDTYPFLISGTYNTYTMFFAYYRDFGILGSFIFSMLFGVLSYTSYARMKRFPDINSISLYGVFTVVILFSFFIPMLSWLHFIYNLTTIHLLTKIIVSKGT
jgi:oligosaccharide repeat unit polymerase